MNIGKLLWSIFKGTLKNVILSTLNDIQVVLSNADPLSMRENEHRQVTLDYRQKHAKDWVCLEIQKKRRVPGKIRRLACQYINLVSAKDLEGWVSAVKALVYRW